MSQSVAGSCHCGAIKYTVDLSSELLSKKSVGRCNCSFCQKPGFTSLSVPESSFKLVTPASKGDLSDYQVNKERHRYFCPQCGVQVMTEGVYEYEGNTYPFFSVNFLTLDQPQDGLDLSEWSVEYCDGLHDNWMAGTKKVPWTGGAL